MGCECAERQALVDVLVRYANCLDDRDWDGLREVFAEDAVGDYGGFVAEGRAALVTSIASYLEGTGPSQHLLGNFEVKVDDDRAWTRCRARLMYLGAGDRRGLTPYETLGTYADEFRRTSDGWRVVRRLFEVQAERGDPSVLGTVGDTRRAP